MASQMRVLAGVCVVVALAAACSSKTDRPAIDTAGNGGKLPSGGGGGGSDASTDGATEAGDDGGTSDDASGEAGPCNNVTCASGCCDTTGVGGCLPGTDPTACGINGGNCISCIANALTICNASHVCTN
jgi:hypothetical protein